MQEQTGLILMDIIECHCDNICYFILYVFILKDVFLRVLMVKYILIISSSNMLDE